MSAAPLHQHPLTLIRTLLCQRPDPHPEGWMGLQLTLSKRSQVQGNSNSSSSNKDEIQQPRASHIRKETRHTHPQPNTHPQARTIHRFGVYKADFCLCQNSNNGQVALPKIELDRADTPPHSPTIYKRAYTFHVFGSSLVNPTNPLCWTNRTEC